MESGLHITLAAERLFTIWGIPVTNTLFTTWAVIAILILLGFLVRRNLSIVPGKLQNLVEMFFEYLLGLMEQTLGSRTLAMKYFPLICTIFLFILVGNWLDFIPIFGTLKFGEAPLFHPLNADLNTTLSLAIISFLVIEISGIMTLGTLKYVGKFVNFTGGVMGFLVGLIEIIGNLARLISLSFRLFGAIFAGEVLLLVIGTFVPVVLPVPLMAFEAFIGLLQAAIFAILTLAFIKLAITEHAH
ncbi:F0F1 ATP synthase subunit A [Candidatus Parcubacteria bacterium]|nr:F0F1 ATP synthase subunit A [Candidatus Parcubacteria bacterium]